MDASLKKLGFRIKEFLLRRYFSTKYHRELKRAQREIIQELVEYTGMHPNEVMSKLKHGSELAIARWKRINPKTQEEILKFYQTCKEYIFDLSYFNYFSPLAYAERRGIVDRVKGRVLDCGGGVGSVCIMLAKKGVKDVIYYDVPGATMEFAKWRFNKRDLSITTVEGSEIEDRLDGLYNTVICLDVLEHLTNPELHVKRLADHLTADGKLFITTAFVTDSSCPLHYKSKKTLDEYPRDAGLLPKRAIWEMYTVATKGC